VSRERWDEWPQLVKRVFEPRLDHAAEEAVPHPGGKHDRSSGGGSKRGSKKGKKGKKGKGSKAGAAGRAAPESGFSVEALMRQWRRVRLRLRPEIFANFRNCEFAYQSFNFPALMRRACGRTPRPLGPLHVRRAEDHREPSPEDDVGPSSGGAASTRCELHAFPYRHPFAFLRDEEDDKWMQW